MLNTDSVMIAPPTSSAMSSPNIVTIGVRLARRPCLRITWRSVSPFAARGPDVVLAQRLEEVLRVIPCVRRAA
jgi:hypothetical protein